MTGYRSCYWRHDCNESECFVKSLPDWTDLLDVFPRGIRPTDIDAMVESRGHVLFIEQKGEGVPLPEGQRRAMQVLASKPDIQVLYFRPKGDLVEVLHFPDPQGWRTVTRDHLRQILGDWCDYAEANPRLTLIASRKEAS